MDCTANMTMIQSVDTLIDIDQQILEYIAMLETRASFKENIEVFNMLNIIQMLKDYNQTLLDNNIVGVYLDNAYQQMILDEQTLA